MSDNNTEWPADPGPEGAFETGSNDGGQPSSNDDQGDQGSVTPTPPGDEDSDASGRQAPNEQYIPKYRFDEVRTSSERQAAENARLRQAISHLLNGRPTENQGQPEDPRKARLRETILSIVPELRELGTLTNRESARQTEEEERQNRVAVRTITSVYDVAAKAMLGEGKSAKDLGADERVWIKDSFISWVLNSPERRERYDSGDTATLGSEFWTAYNQRMRATAVRTQSSSILERHGRRQNLPQQGSSSAPVGSQPPNLNLKDEDAVHKAAWGSVVSGR